MKNQSGFVFALRLCGVSLREQTKKAKTAFGFGLEPIWRLSFPSGF